MFIFLITYFSLILNPEIKFIILKKNGSSKHRKNNGGRLLGEDIFNFNSTHQKTKKYTYYAKQTCCLRTCSE